MAAEKSSAKKVMDVSRPSQVAAEPTSRPVIVTNRPLITQDPMVASSTDAATDTAKTTASKQAAPLAPHAEKVIKPPKETTVDAEPEAEKEKSESEEEPFRIGSKENAGEAAVKEAKETEKAAETPVEPEATGEASESETAGETTDKTDKSKDAPSKPDGDETPGDAADAEKSAEGMVEYDAPEDDKQIIPGAEKVSAEEQKRADELEEIIASGKYNVPIDASGRRKTLIVTIWLVVLTLVLAVVLVDALLDVGMLTIPGIPHTHFFSIT